MMLSLDYRTAKIRAGRICFILLLVLSASRLEAQEVHWTSFSKLKDSLRQEARPLLIFIHTDWCKYCALQDHNTFSDKKTSEWINEKFYALRLNAESPEAITFLNRTYHGAGKNYHELADFLASHQGQVVFPSTIILSEKFQPEKKWTGFVSSEMLEAYFER